MTNIPATKTRKNVVTEQNWASAASLSSWLEFANIWIFITVDIFKYTAKKIRKLNEQIKFYLKGLVRFLVHNYVTL
jgi:hypothetical protein